MAISPDNDGKNNHFSEQTSHAERGQFPRDRWDHRKAFGLDSTIHRGFKYSPVDLSRSLLATQSSPQVQGDMRARVMKYRQNIPRG